jgi:hypothetical protein
MNLLDSSESSFYVLLKVTEDDHLKIFCSTLLRGAVTVCKSSRDTFFKKKGIVNWEPKGN